MSKCKQHNWEILSKDILPSAYEQLVQSGSVIETMRGFNTEYFQKKLILILKCTECGTLDKTVEVNP